MNAELLHDALNLLPGDLITATDRLRSRPRKKTVRWLRRAAMAACFALILCGGILLAPFFFGMGGSTEAMLEESLQYAADNAMGEAEGPKDLFPASTDGKLANGTGEGAGEAPEAANPVETKATVPTGAATYDPDCLGDIPAEPNESFDGPAGIYVGGSAGYSVTYGHKEGVEYPQVTVIRSRQELEDYYDAYRDDYDIDSLEDGCVHWTESFFAEHDLLMILLEENDGYECPEVGWLNQLENGNWELTFQGYFEVGEGIDAETPWHVYVEIEKDLIAPEDTIQLVFE